MTKSKIAAAPALFEVSWTIGDDGLLKSPLVRAVRWHLSNGFKHGTALMVACPLVSLFGPSFTCYFNVEETQGMEC